MAKNGKIIRTDGRGIIAGDYLGLDREVTRSQWLEDVFPEWGTWLNKQIAATKLNKQFGLWWLGGPSWVYKSSGDTTFLVDNYAGPSCYTEYDYCGVCRISGAETLDWMRTHPQVIDPWGFEKLDAVFSTHHHMDHCDIYTVKAALQTSNCKFIGPESTYGKFKRWGVPEDRIIKVKPGDVIKINDVEIAVEKNFDSVASMANDYKPGDPLDFDKNAVSFVLKSSGGNVIFLGDTLYNNGYSGVGKRHQIDVAIFDMGHNAPGMTDKMSPFDAYRVGLSLGAKVLIPDHYENWACSEIDPNQLTWIVEQNAPEMKVAILKHGARFIYPDDQDIKAYKYPDWRERARWQYSYEYGDPKLLK
jgi:L-ascorbate 6-phosphate lactonase